MHISEGVLNISIISTGYILTSGGLSIGLKSLEGEKIVRSAVLSSGFFIAALIHIPLGPGNIHLILNGLLGLLLGWSSFCAIFIALLMQAIIFQFGGLTTLGINTFNLACPALICYFLFGRYLRSQKIPVFAIGFIAGALSVFLSCIAVCLTLYVSNESFVNTSWLIFITHLPLMVVEGFVTATILQFIKKVKPEMLSDNNSFI